MTTIQFTVLGQPTGKGRPRVTRRGITYTPDKTVQAEQSFLAQALPYKPDKPLEGPLALALAFYYQIPRSWSAKQKARALIGEIRPVIRPDLDNAIKLIDALNGVFWVDDASIVDLEASKFYGGVPRTEVTIASLSELSPG